MSGKFTSIYDIALLPFHMLVSALIRLDSKVNKIPNERKKKTFEKSFPDKIRNICLTQNEWTSQQIHRFLLFQSIYDEQNISYSHTICTHICYIQMKNKIKNNKTNGVDR